MKSLFRALTLAIALCIPPAFAAPTAEADAPRAVMPSEDAMADLVLQAVSLMGIAYRFGGNTPVSGFDCSGFIRYIFQRSAGIDLPRTAAEQAQLGRPIEREELKPGDILFFNTRGFKYSHNALYLGNGRFIHAPRTGKNIEIGHLSSEYWSGRVNGGRRLSKGGANVREFTESQRRAENAKIDKAEKAASEDTARDTASVSPVLAAATLGAVGGAGGAVAALKSKRVTVTLPAKPVKIPELSAACKRASQAKTPKCKKEKVEIAQAEAAAKKAGKLDPRGKADKGGKQGKDRQDSKANAKDKKYRAVSGKNSSKDSKQGKVSTRKQAPTKPVAKKTGRR